MIFAPLIFGILQNDDLIRRQQRLDLFDGSRAVGLETRPDILPLSARRINSSGVFRHARLPAHVQSRVYAGLIGNLIFLARLGEVVLEWLQLDPLPAGKLAFFP